VIVFRRADIGALNQVFRGQLAAGVAAGATQFDLDEGQGELLPELAAGETLVLRLGSDSGFRPVVITGRDGDTLYCEALDRDWPMGTPVVAAVLAEILEAFVQRSEIGTAAGHDAGDFATPAGLAAAIAAHLTGNPHPQYLQSITTGAPSDITGILFATGTAIRAATWSDVPAMDASKITSGTIDLARLPAGALERLVPVADQTARYALTTASVQNGDTVRQLDTGEMFVVVDEAHLGDSAGYVSYTAGTATSVPWSGVTGKPANITALAALTGAADRLPYFTGSGSMALAVFTSLARTLAAAANSAAFAAGLGGDGSAGKFFTAAGTFAPAEAVYTGSATWNPPSIANGAQASTTVNVMGAIVGDFVGRIATSAPLGGLRAWGEVTAPSVVTVYLANQTGGAVDLGSMTVWVVVTDNPSATPPDSTLDPANKSSNISLSNGNLTASSSTASWGSARGTIPAGAGVKHFDMTVNAGAYAFIGVIGSAGNVNTYVGSDAHSWGWDSNGGTPVKFHSGAQVSYGAAWGAGDTVRAEVDFDAGTISFCKWSGGAWVSQGVAYTGVSGALYPAISLYSASGTASVTVDLSGWE
jgi:hypothetical protein